MYAVVIWRTQVVDSLAGVKGEGGWTESCRARCRGMLYYVHQSVGGLDSTGHCTTGVHLRTRCQFTCLDVYQLSRHPSVSHRLSTNSTIPTSP